MLRSLVLGFSLLMSHQLVQAQDIFIMKKSGELSFFSSTPIEDIKAVNKKSSSILKADEGNITVKIPVRTFEFEKDMMYQHFLEKRYMWAEEYPFIDFSGSIEGIESLDFSKDIEETEVMVTGNMTVRGETQEYSFPATMSKTGKKVKGSATFKVVLADHGIKVPDMVVENVAEEVEINLQFEWERLVVEDKK